MDNSFTMTQNTTPSLDTLVEEYKRLKQAETLLTELYRQLGPYLELDGFKELQRDMWGVEKDDLLVISPRLWARVRDYFEFDDSE